MMQCNISKDRSFKILEWILFIGFIITSGWFTSGVLQQFFSHKTSFSQSKEKVTTYPVVNIDFGHPSSEVRIKYHSDGMDSTYLEMGENLLHNSWFNKNEKVILQRHKNIWNNKGIRIIHATPILEKNLAQVNIQIESKKANETKWSWNNIGKNLWSNLAYIYITSQKNSPGLTFYNWKDGKPLQIKMNKNTYVEYNIHPQITKYLEKSGNCQVEPYYKCVASQLDAMEFNECPNKCIPSSFSNLGKNHTTPICQYDTDNEHCIFKIIKKINDQEIASDCKKACFHLEYFGEFALIMPFYLNRGKKWNVYHFSYTLNNQDFEAALHEEYFIYDIVGMIGSVGGTFGMDLH